MFLFIYSVELLARFYTDGLKCFRSGWVVFDFFLVVNGLLAAYVVPLFEAYFLDEDNRASTDFLLVLRAFRLAKLARMIRLISQFQVLWKLVRGVLSSAGVMTHVFILFGIILYVFACMGKRTHT